MIPLVRSAAGVRFRVRVTPRAGRTGVAGERNGALMIRLAAAPVDDAANDALIAYLATLFDTARGNVTIEAGARSREKTIAIAGATVERVAATLVVILPA